MAMNVLDGTRKPLGCYQTADLSTAAAAPSIPSNAKAARIQAVDNAVSWRDDGTTATNSAGGSFGGMILAAGSELWYVGDLTQLSFIEAVAASTAYINIAYYA